MDLNIQHLTWAQRICGLACHCLPLLCHHWYVAPADANTFLSLHTGVEQNTDCSLGIRLPLSNDVWEALAHHAHLECRMLCEDVVNLPRELRDVIYDALLDDMGQAIAPGKFSHHRQSSWRDSLPHLSGSPSGQMFLHEFMGLFYSRTSFKLAYKISGRTAPGDKFVRVRSGQGSNRGTSLRPTELPPGIPPFDTPLSSLLLRDPFGSTHVPATLIDEIEITIPRNYHEWEHPSPAEQLEVAKDAMPIKDSKVKIVIKAAHYGRRYLSAKSCYRGPPRREPTVYTKELLRSLAPALTRWTELGVDVQLNDVDYGAVRELYPTSAILTEVREEVRIRCVLAFQYR